MLDLKIKKINRLKILLFIETILLVVALSYLIQNKTADFKENVKPNQPLLEAKVASPNLNDQKAIIGILDLQEVKEFKKLLGDNNNSTLGIMVTDYPDIGKPYFTVKVYESFADHDTVFNWYRVTVEGAISKQDLSAQDKWDVVQVKTISLLPEPSPKTVVVEKEVPAQCLITQGKYDVDMRGKNDQIADIQQALNYANLEIGRLSSEVFMLRGRGILNEY